MPGVEPVEVLADGAPAPVEAGRVAVPAGELRAQLRQHLVGHGRIAEPILTEELERHALAHLRLVPRLGEQLHVGVGVHVDEPGADEEPTRVDRPPRRLIDASDRADAVAGDRDVGGERRRAGAVDHATATEDQVEHAS
jgi:hypothetical protein